MRSWFHLLLSIILIHSNVHAGKDFPAENGYLVHVTRTMLKASTAVPGATINGEITDPSKAPEIRITLHHAYHGMVPDEAMGASVTLWGMPTSMPSSANQHRKYAWIDQFKNFAGHNFGGEMNDIYTLGHTYGAGSFVVVPEEERKDFTKANPEYDGTIVTYLDGENIRNVINQALIKASGLVINYTRKDPSSIKHQHQQAYWLDIDGERIPEETVLDFLKTQNFLQSDHNHSPFWHYESILSPLSNPFHSSHRELKKPYKSFKTSPHMEILLSLYPFVKERLCLASAHLDADHRERIDRWLAGNQTFVDLLRMELDLRKQNRSLFFDNPKLKEHIRQRATLNIEQASEDLHELTADEMRELEGTETTGDSFFVSAYLSSIFSFEPQFYSAFIAATPCSPVKKSIFQIDRLITLYLRTHQMDEPWVEAMAAAVTPLRRTRIEPDEFKKIQDYFNIHIWDKFWKDTSRGGERILALYNHPSFGIILRQLMLFAPNPNPTYEEILHLLLAGKKDEAMKLMTPKLPDHKPLDLLGILKITGSGQYFWGERAFTVGQLPFLKNILRQVFVNTLKEARNINNAYHSAENAATMLPLAYVHFCGDLLDTFLSRKPPARMLTEGEKGILIGQLNLMLPNLYKASEKQFHLSVPPAPENDEKREIRQLFIDQLIAEKTCEDALASEEESPSLAPKLHALLEETVKAPPQYTHPLSPAETYQLLNRPDTSFLSLVRGGCFGGLQGIIKEYGYEEACQQYFGAYQDTMWYLDDDLFLGGNTINSLFSLLRDVQTSGAESVRRRYEQPDNFWF